LLCRSAPDNDPIALRETIDELLKDIVAKEWVAMARLLAFSPILEA
jgi:hypothetical protein